MSNLYELRALCDINERRVKENAKRWGVKSYYTNVLKLFENLELDLVLVCTPPDANPIITRIAAEHGVNVIVEIPIAPTLSLADDMIRVTKHYGVKLEVAENVYRWAREQFKRKIINRGLLGELAYAKLIYISGSYHGFNAIRMLLNSEFF